MKELKIDGVFDLSDEELWQKHIEEYPQIKSWSEEKREGARKGFISGLAEGRKEKWHDLREKPDDLPNCAENEQVIFYVQEYYEGIDKYKNHYCLGFYKKSFLNDDVKLFVERSKGYECEHSTEDVLCWCELPKFEE